MNARKLLLAVALTAVAAALNAGSANGAAPTTVTISGHATVAGPNFSAHTLFEYRTRFSAVQRPETCKGYARGDYDTGPFSNGHGTITTPGFSAPVSGATGDARTDDRFYGWGLQFFYHGPGVYHLHIADEYLGMRGGPHGTNDGFEIQAPGGSFAVPPDTNPVDLTVTVHPDGSGSVVQKSPSSYEEDWTCGNPKPQPAHPKLELADLAHPNPLPQAKLGDVMSGDRIKLVGSGFNPKKGPIELNFVWFGEHEKRHQERIATVQSASFNRTYRLREFPSGECFVFFDAVQGKHHEQAQARGNPAGTVELAQGEAKLPAQGEPLRQGGRICQGHEPVIQRMDRGLHPGQALIVNHTIAVSEPGFNAHTTTLLLAIHREGQPRVVGELLVSGKRMTVALPHGTFRYTPDAKLPPADPAQFATSPTCHQLPAVTGGVELNGCNYRTGQVRFADPLRLACGSIDSQTFATTNVLLAVERGLRVVGSNPRYPCQLQVQGSLTIKGGIEDFAELPLELTASDFIDIS